jgi:hypothetical protein
VNTLFEEKTKGFPKGRVAIALFNRLHPINRHFLHETVVDSRSVTLMEKAPFVLPTESCDRLIINQLLKPIPLAIIVILTPHPERFGWGRQYL